jgi:hypothetical protein
MLRVLKVAACNGLSHTSAVMPGLKTRPTPPTAIPAFDIRH